MENRERNNEFVGSPTIRTEEKKEWWQNLGMRIPKAIVYKAFGTSDTSFRNEMKKAGIEINVNKHFTPKEFEELCLKIHIPRQEVIEMYIDTKMKG